MAGGEHFAGRRFTQDPLERFVAGAPRVGGVADPVVVHVQPERGCRRVLCEPPRLAADLDEVHAEAAEFLRHRHLQIARRFQLVEVFLEEAVVAVVSGARSRHLSRSDCVSIDSAVVVMSVTPLWISDARTQEYITI